MNCNQHDIIIGTFVTHIKIDMKREFITTADGSTSIYLEEMDEHYHSTHGAIAESEHIFVASGLLAKKDLSIINVFEVGMGTGLNVMTTYQTAQKQQLTIDYHTVEAFPIKTEELSHINFSSLLEIEDSIFQKIHFESWNQEFLLAEKFKLKKFNSKLIETDLEDNFFDVIYFDAFAPEKQEEMWSEEIFEKMFRTLKQGGVLVTYCVKGVIRRRLQSVGFKVEKLKGPVGGKREMCRAWKPK